MLVKSSRIIMLYVFFVFFYVYMYLSYIHSKLLKQFRLFDVIVEIYSKTTIIH